MDNALYFPFISVPENTWFTRVLLYWDQVSSIIPFEFVERPDQLTKYTRELLTNELLVQIHPADYIGGTPRFKDAFLKYLGSLTISELNKRRKAFLMFSRSRIHVEKMQEISEYLIHEGLAREVDWSWFDVEKKTANEFMIYLAILLGQHKEIRSTPVTDTVSNLNPFLLASHSKPRIESGLAPLRKIVLEQLLPVPVLPIEPERLNAFKRRYGALLPSYRYSIEQELAAISDMSNPDLRDYRLENFIAEKQAETGQICARLSEGGLGRISFAKVWAIVAAIPKADPWLGLAHAVHSALSGTSGQIKSGPLLYAAYVKKKLG